MNNRTLCLLLLTLLAAPAATVARQNKAPKPEKTQQKSATTTAPAPPSEVESWSALSDINSGLEPRPVVVGERDDESDFVRELVQVQWRAADPIDLWIMRPKVTGKVPVILYLYSYPTDDDVFRDNGWAKRATSGGFAAVGFVSALTGQRYHMRPIKQWFVSELPESLGSSTHDVQLILNYLASRGDMDTDHVGMFGMGSGATIAILAAHADPRIKAIDLLDPWGDWPDWMKESPAVPENERPRYITPEFLKSVAMLDPVAYLPTLKSAHFRLQQTLTDPATPKDAKERIASSVADERFVVKYANAQLLMDAWRNSGLSGWIKQQLRPTIQNVQAVGATPSNSDPARN